MQSGIEELPSGSRLEQLNEGADDELPLLRTKLPNVALKQLLQA